MAEHEDHDEHDHGVIHFQGTDVTDGALAQIRETHAPLADALDLTRRWTQLSEEEKKGAIEKQTAIETHEAWMPGFHAPGDRCAACGLPTLALFTDRMQEGEIPYGAFVHGLPVHATKACLDALAKQKRDHSPRGLDKARRELMRDLDRPSPRMTQFLRHDLLAHPPFGLEDWGNSVAEAQKDGLSKSAMKDIERLMRYVHQRLFHGH
ncbi:MAG TPA: hypothetical protein VM370_10300 [Candidatus Thermoplasmatota archaeon]|nr:hypothetical protein [Candidatus Thermoplasmatota archaeon]